MARDTVDPMVSALLGSDAFEERFDTFNEYKDERLSFDMGAVRKMLDLAREFRLAATSAGWGAERLKSHADDLDRIAFELLLEEDGAGA